MLKKVVKNFKNLFEANDGKPAAIPVNYQRPPTLHEQIARFVHSAQLRQELAAAGAETFEESEDFDVPDDNAHDMTSPHERFYDEDLGREISNAERPYVNELKKEADRAVKEAVTTARKKPKFEEEVPKKTKKDEE